MAVDVLPDSRARERRGSIKGPDGIEYVPIYCINCGRRYGMVPATTITHVTALCDHGCAGQYGDLAHTYVDGDEKYKLDAAEAMAKLVARLGRPVTAAELDEIAKDSTSPLAAVARDWRARVSKEL
jgi:hypothetical protein